MQDMAGRADIDCTDANLATMSEKAEPGNSAASFLSFEDDEPTEEEKATLQYVSDKLPWSTFLIAVIELCERFTFYGLSGPFQNYIQHHYNDPSGLPGALGVLNSKRWLI